MNLFYLLLLIIFHVFILCRGNTSETRGTAFVVYEDIFDAKNACDHLSGFNVCNRYLVVLYYQSNKVIFRNKFYSSINEYLLFCYLLLKLYVLDLILEFEFIFHEQLNKFELRLEIICLIFFLNKICLFENSAFFTDHYTY